jgi:sugar lactone lactonase YvrE
VAGPRRGVVDLGWSGPELWVLDEAGLARSPGAILPWRPVSDRAPPGAVLAGGSDRLWLLGGDGTFAEARPVACDSPFAESSGGERGLREPRGLAVSPAGWFVVADTFGHRVRWYAPDGTCLDELGGEGADPGRFREPSGVAVSPGGAVAVTDTWNGRVQVLQPDGSIQVLGGELYGPRGVMWDVDGELWVADTGNRRVLRYRLPHSAPELTVELEAPVVGLARLADSVAVAVPVAGKVVRLDPVDGRQVGELPVPGWSGGLQQEGYLAVLDDGTLLASAPHPGELWRLDPAGGAPELVRADVAGLTALAVDGDGGVIGALTWQHRLVRLGRPVTADGGE